VVAGTGTLCIAACLGFGRFALGMLLPSMASSLRLSYAQLGWIGTGNFVGYLAAVLFCGAVAARVGPRLLIFAALLLVAGSMWLMSRAGGFAGLLLLYAATGIGSGAANVPVQGLVARWFDASVRGRAAGFVSIGSGFAIVASGQLIPFINRRQGAGGWRTSWLVLSLAVAAIALLALLLFRNRPEEKGLRPYGAGPEPAPGAAAPPPAPAHPRFHANRSVWLLGLIYAIFGYTYAIYVTFIVTALVRERGFSESAAGTFWSAVGLLSLLSGPVFGWLSDRLGRRAGLMVVFAFQLVAYLMAGADLPRAFLSLSVGLFGLVAWSVPTIMVAAVADRVGADQALPAFGFLTFFFGVGQIAGPAVAGLLAQRTGTFSSSFLMAAAFAGAAIAASGLLGRSPRP
jgi:sugar phosphate permease